MRLGTLNVSFLLASTLVPVAVSCSSPVDGDGGTGDIGNSGAASGGTSTGGVATGGAPTGGVPSGGTSGATTGGSGATAGAGPTGGVAGAGATGGSAGISGNAGSGTAGAGVGGAGGAAGSGIGGSVVGGAGGTPPLPPLDCGGKGAVIENAGPPANRVNYFILGDGYTQAELDAPATQTGSYLNHIQVYMTKRFSDPIGQPYLRYRKFVNICAVKVPSTGDICGSSAFSCCGDDQSRLANCNGTAANNAFNENLPDGVEIDWRAVVLNGSSWWNTGAALMLWSGGNRDAAGAALHEGGHGHHSLADEYGGCSGGRQVNVHTSSGSTGGKWDAWIGYTQTGATGLQDFFQCDGNVYRPTDNSMMNSLFGNNPNTSFNAVSREKMIMDIWRIVANPWDSVVPPAGAVTNPATLTVNVIDPAVVSVDWSVDGTMVAANMGGTFNVAAAGLTPGSHMISARAYDNAGMDLVRQTTGTSHNRQYWGMNAQKTVTWTVTIQ